MSALLRLEALSKAYYGVPAVEDVTLDVAQGAVLGLIGENGAGKSTLMNMVGGVLAPSSGQMFWRGEPYAPAGAAAAAARGVAFIHQELNLFLNLSVAENLFVDGFPKKLGLIDRRAIRERAAELLAALDLHVSPDAAVGDLSPGERQLVEIAKALHRDAALIIFDEPTTSLTPRETTRLFEVIERLRDQGKTIIYISHVLGDVARLCDTVAVLRDGRLIESGKVADFDIPRMIHAMIGRALSGLFPERTARPEADIALKVSGLGQPGVLENVSFDLRRGEILGLFGLMGSGRTELARVLFGLDPAEQGEIVLAGTPLTGSPRARIEAGLAFVTEDRRAEGLMMESPIEDNLALVSISRFGRAPAALIDAEALAEEALETAGRVQLKAGKIDRQPAKSLSGGNQQKVVIGKWLMSGPRVFILDEPTRGVDVGAKYEIYTLADQLAAAGGAVLFISSEIDELMGVCDRILVMSRGEIVGGFDAPPFEQSAILSMAFRETA
ncbi:sugar ABC transporter ATP-binding protein [Acuticoccus sp. MNP-M23]|uniref:sugar ABC transporter ATP-binding protein n=1 Tax=Acuticoccus sp. MNP-M23 TaxID=3072793 RepID=UPI002815094B|nr:sugar ABC transporter ATP-binding protein [Acuticoccus sp. MNP-M23]WMS41972.1 sugar ABC transporter ATP-binding protein [Acuticoccus sp. MNP-M23]